MIFLTKTCKNIHQKMPRIQNSFDAQKTQLTPCEIKFRNIPAKIQIRKFKL